MKKKIKWLVWKFEKMSRNKDLFGSIGREKQPRKTREVF
jgi:hypothetical protein